MGRCTAGTKRPGRCAVEIRPTDRASQRSEATGPADASSASYRLNVTVLPASRDRARADKEFRKRPGQGRQRVAANGLLGCSRFERCLACPRRRYWAPQRALGSGRLGDQCEASEVLHGRSRKRKDRVQTDDLRTPNGRGLGGFPHYSGIPPAVWSSPLDSHRLRRMIDVSCSPRRIMDVWYSHGEVSRSVGLSARSNRPGDADTADTADTELHNGFHA